MPDEHGRGRRKERELRFAVCVLSGELVKMDYFARSYDALRAAPQSGSDTIEKLCERLLNGASIEERKAALLGLKGLSRDWKAVSFARCSAHSSLIRVRFQEVGIRALPILLGVLQEDAPEDIETAKAVVETLSLLCEVEELDGKVRFQQKQRLTPLTIPSSSPYATTRDSAIPTSSSLLLHPSTSFSASSPRRISTFASFACKFSVSSSPIALPRSSLTSSPPLVVSGDSSRL